MERYNASLSFFSRDYFQKLIGTSDTTRDITVKKTLFSKILKTIDQLKDLKQLSIFNKNSNTWK